jgi:hypothetical protein
MPDAARERIGGQLAKMENGQSLATELLAA